MTMRSSAGGYQLDTDADRLDLDRIERWLAAESYWAVALIRDDLLNLGVYRIVLATNDAHELYAKVGFTAPAEPQKWMELNTRTREPRP